MNKLLISSTLMNFILMKNLFLPFLLVLVFLSKSSLAQSPIIINGITLNATLDANGNYAYSDWNGVGFGSTILYLEKYADNRWYVSSYVPYSGGGRWMNRRTVDQYTDTTPPCNAFWEAHSTSLQFSAYPSVAFLNSVTFSSLGYKFISSGCTPITSNSSSSTSGGFVPPQLTTVQINALVNPAPGTMVYDITVPCLKYYNPISNIWVCFP